MIIVLNGYPGTGKLTIGVELAAMLGARLVDIHSLYNVAFATTEPKSELFYQTVRDVEAIAYDRIVRLPPEVPVVMTTVLTPSNDWAFEEWNRLETLGTARPPFVVVHIQCSLDENIVRIASPGRSSSRKPTDAEMARRNQEEAKPLMGGDVQNFLQLDTTNLSPPESAQAITDWVAMVD